MIRNKNQRTKRLYTKYARIHWTLLIGLFLFYLPFLIGSILDYSSAPLNVYGLILLAYVFYRVSYAGNRCLYIDEDHLGIFGAFSVKKLDFKKIYRVSTYDDRSKLHIDDSKLRIFVKFVEHKTKKEVSFECHTFEYQTQVLNFFQEVVDERIIKEKAFAEFGVEKVDGFFTFNKDKYGFYLNESGCNGNRDKLLKYYIAVLVLFYIIFLGFCSI